MWAWVSQCQLAYNSEGVPNIFLSLFLFDLNCEFVWQCLSFPFSLLSSLSFSLRRTMKMMTSWGGRMTIFKYSHTEFTSWPDVSVSDALFCFTKFLVQRTLWEKWIASEWTPVFSLGKEEKDEDEEASFFYPLWNSCYDILTFVKMRHFFFLFSLPLFFSPLLLNIIVL